MAAHAFVGGREPIGCFEGAVVVCDGPFFYGAMWFETKI